MARYAIGALLLLFVSNVLWAAPAGPADEPPSDTKEGFVESWLDGLRLFGNVRFRGEFRANEDFDKTSDDTREYIGQRVQLGAEKQFPKGFTARIVLQDSRVWGGSPGSDTGLSTAGSESGESTDLREAWIEVEDIFAAPLALRAGRQLLAYGDQRLVGHLNWTHVGRSFDALRFRLDTKHFESHLFGAVLAEEDSDSATNTTAVGRSNPSGIRFTCSATTGVCTTSATKARELDDAYLSGWYNTLRLHPQLLLDLYALGVHKKWIPAETPVATISGAEITTQDRSRQRDNLYTFGARVTNRTKEGGSKAPGAFDYSLEYAAQRGFTGEEIAARWDPLQTQVAQVNALGQPLLDASGNQITKPLYVEKRRYHAYAYAGKAGYRIGPVRLGGEFAAASGDRDRTNATVRTFNNLFPTNHGHYGQADQVGWSNMRAAALDLTWHVSKSDRIGLAYWVVRKHTRQDGWYGAAGTLRTNASTESQSDARFGNVTDATGTVTARGVSTLGRHLFRELDIGWWFKARGLDWVVGYSAIRAGDAVRQQRDDILTPAASRRMRFDPRADIAFVMMSATF